VESKHRPNRESRQTLPDYAKGGELVLKPFVFTQAFAASTADALRRRDEGQTMAEYGVVLAVITIAVFTALALLSGNIVNAINRVAGYVS
jgi:Flp pilus assembly pilin Flp